MEAKLFWCAGIKLPENVEWINWTDIIRIDEEMVQVWCEQSWWKVIELTISVKWEINWVIYPTKTDNKGGCVNVDSDTCVIKI